MKSYSKSINTEYFHLQEQIFDSRISFQSANTQYTKDVYKEHQQAA